MRKANWPARFDVPTYILPRPLEIIATVFADGRLLGDALTLTLAEALIGFLEDCNFQT